MDRVDPGAPWAGAAEAGGIAERRSPSNTGSAWTAQLAGRDDFLCQQRRHRASIAIDWRGSRVLAELIDEIDRYDGLGTGLDDRLERYARPDTVILAPMGGDRFPTAPIWAVPDG